jgi:mannose-6-phosphate isomerase
MDQPYPLKLAPKASERLWGGERLRSSIPAFQAFKTTEPIGEAWLVYADNTIINGDYSGQTLQDLATAQGANLLGTSPTARYGTTFPLLAKLIDASDKLSIQVHPDDAYALSQEAATGYLGKTEAWYILEAAPEAEIIWGFSESLSPQQLRNAIEEGTLERYLNTVPVRAGDVILNPAGTVHAIGAGILLFEIQQSSDLTYRLYDFQRRDASGQLRELHVDKALDVSDLQPGNRAKILPKQLSPQITQLVATEHFVMDELQLPGLPELTTRPESLELLTVLGGAVTIHHDGEPVILEQTEAAVLPAVLGAYSLEGSGRVIRCTIP